MSAADKTVTLTFTPFLVKVVITPLTIPQTNPDTATHTWTKSCTATTTRSGVTLDTITKEVAEAVTSIDFGQVFFKDDSIVLTCNLKQTFGGSTSTLTAAAVTSTVTIPDAQNKDVALTYNNFMYNLKVKYVVSQTPSNNRKTFEKSCTVVQTRSGTQVSSTTKTEATNGGETSSTASSLDFGTTYQSGDAIAATCKVIETTTAPGSSPTDKFEQSKTENMVAEDKVITIIAA
eukprot:00282.XXX_1044_1826_1 [CDS] Oithona nana genome sequencing.